jgi:signal recognition particle subunit SRP54
MMGMMPGMARCKAAGRGGLRRHGHPPPDRADPVHDQEGTRQPQILQASRKKRIAAGAGQEVSDLNKLLKMQRQMADMMKKLGKMGKKGMLRRSRRADGQGYAAGAEGHGPRVDGPQGDGGRRPAMGQGGLPGLGGGALPPGLSGFGKKK